MKFLDSLTGGYSSSAKVVGGALILSLPDAVSPVVWRMDLDDIKAAAFEIKEKDGIHTLMMKSNKGDAQEIAPFENKGTALKALMAASHAMEQASQITKNPANSNDTVHGVPATKGKSPLVAGFVGIVILGLLFFGLTQVSPKTPQSTSGIGATEAPSGSPSATGRPGVPMSADDFLRAK